MNAGQLMTVACLGLALLGGCMASEPIAPGRMDDAWQLTPSQWNEAQAQSLTVNDRQAPYRYEVAYEPSVAWSVIGLHRTAEQFAELTEVARFPISETHARAIAALLRRLADRAARLADALESTGRGAETRWAEATAAILAQAHEVVASVNPDPARRAELTIDETTGWVLVPMLEMLANALYDEPAARPGEQAEQLARTEQAVARTLLTIAFRLTGRPLPNDALRDVLQVLRTQPHDKAARNATKLLLAYRHLTPRTYEPMRDAAAEAARAARRFAGALRYLADLSGQWANVDTLAVEIRSLGERRVVAFEFAVKPGRRVVWRGPNALAPDVVFTGHGRVVVQPEEFSAERMAFAVLFESDADGGMTLNFGGLAFSLVRLFAFPLETARLREIRYRSGLAAEGQSGREVTVFLAPPGDGAGRQMIRFESASVPRFKDRPDLPPQLLGREETIRFEYLNEQRRWHYERTKFAKPQLWGP